MSFIEFIVPLGFLGLIGVPIVILIYLIKSRYVQKPVASTFIWKRSLNYVKRKIPLKVILSLLLILQILTVVVASLAITRPEIGLTISADEKIILLDASASMQTTDGKETRFDAAKNYILQESKNLGDTGKLSVILVGTEATTIVRRENDEINITRELENLICTNSEISEEVMDLARDKAEEILKENIDAKVIFLTDKDFSSADNIEVVNISRPKDRNVAIIGASASKDLSGDYAFTAEIAGYGADFKCTVGIYVDGNEYPSGVGNITVSNVGDLSQDLVPTEVIFTPNRNVVPDPALGHTQAVVYIDGFDKYKEIKIEIMVNDGGTDGIASDNIYYIYPQEEISPSILFISKNLKFKEDGTVDLGQPTALYAALGVNKYTVHSKDMFKSVDQYLNTGAELAGYDLYIFEGVELPEYEMFPKDGAVWIFNPPEMPDWIGITYGQEIVAPNNTSYFNMMLSGTNTNIYNTITEDLDCQPAVFKYRPMVIDGSVASFDKIFSEKETNEALFVAGTSKSIRMVITSFDFNYSEWASLVTDYVLLIENLVDYSVPDVLTETHFNVGEEFSFNAPAGAEKITLKHNGVLMQATTDLTLTHVLNEYGVYEITVEFAEKDDAVYKISTHLADSESNVVIAGESVEGPPIPSSGESLNKTEYIPLFRYLLMLLLLLLIAEWGVYTHDRV